MSDLNFLKKVLKSFLPMGTHWQLSVDKVIDSYERDRLIVPHNATHWVDDFLGTDNPDVKAALFNGLMLGAMVHDYIRTDEGRKATEEHLNQFKRDLGENVTDITTARRKGKNDGKDRQ